nr:putative reverse transcriptase domain-containing protein [Tanacetum cinerariifolium]
MLVDDDRNQLVPTSNLESDSEMEVVFDEIANLMTSTSFKGGSDKGYGTNSMLEQWRKQNGMMTTTRDREFHSLQGQVDEFPFSNMETLLDEVNGLYDGACNAQQVMETITNKTVVLFSRVVNEVSGINPNMFDYNLTIKHAAKNTTLSLVAIEQLISQQVADAIYAYETNRNIRARINDGARASDTADGVENIAHGCSYKEFLNYKPHNFNGTEGAVGFIRWFEKMESVSIFITALKTAKSNMPLAPYKMGLTPKIQENVTSSKANTIKSAIRIAHDLMDQVVYQGARVVKSADNKRKWEDNPKRNFSQQQNKRNKIIRAYTIGLNVKKGCTGSQPYCNKCNLRHSDICNDPYGKCKWHSHKTKDYRNHTSIVNHGAAGCNFEC